MSTSRIIFVTVLSCLAGLLAGFAVTTADFRNTQAGHAAVPGALTSVSLQQGAQSGADMNAAADLVGPGGNFVTAAYKKVSPAVVHITNNVEYIDFWFGPQQRSETGSGVIVDDRGYVLTNNHVIAGGKTLTVLTNDGKQYSAKVIGADPGTDLALIKIEPQGKLPAAELGDSASLDVGEWVVAIGNPYGFDWTVTAGVVSALNRSIVQQQNGQSNQTIRGLIQTDAAINPGNSGGPLINAAGQVIGINDAIISSSGGSEGIGLAIPVNTAKAILGDLIKYGRVIRPWLGVEVAGEINAGTAHRLRLPVNYGIVLSKVYASTPAAKAGLIPAVQLQDGSFQLDIIVAVDGKKLESAQMLLDVVRNHKAGDVITLDIYHVTNTAQTPKKLKVTLENLPANAPSLGII